jgi:hypothetical protein
MKDELVEMVMEKTGLSKEMATRAADTVIGFLKTKLPGPVATQLDAALSSEGGSDDIGKVAGQLGGMLGKK